jgi:hypothetical protein
MGRVCKVLILKFERLRNAIESGKFQPSLELAFKLAQTFGKRVDEPKT